VTTSARLLRLLSLLQSRPYWSGPELADRLEVTTRTVRRDVQRLRDLGYPVDGAPGEAGGYRLGNGGDLPPLLLDDDEATAVAVALGVTTGGAVRGLEEPALAALAKLDRLLPPRLRARVEALHDATVTLTGPTSADAVDAELLVTLAQACAGHERVEVDYEDRTGNRTTRRLEPSRLVATGRRWYLVAADVDRGQWRTFRVDRMREARRTGHRFVPDPDVPDAAGLVVEGTTVAPYRYRAVVAFPATPAEELARRVPATVGTVTPGRRGKGCVLVTGSDHLEALAGHLVGLGLDFEVREPVELQRHLREVAERLRRAAPRKTSPAN
jgi:predicted DNA-binding transcriptional regulator YafY